jgi:hypothetical protein
MSDDNHDNHDDHNDNEGDISGPSESALDDLFVEGARFREPSAAERAAWAKEQRKELKKTKRKRQRERRAAPDGTERGPRSGKRGAIALVVLFALTFVVFYVFNPGGGGGGSSNNSANALLETQPREIGVYYAVPQGTTADPGARVAIEHDLGEVQNWLASQTGGKVLRFKGVDGAIDVQTRELNTTAEELKTSANADGLVHDAFLDNGQEPNEIVLAFVPVDRGTDCGQGRLGFAVVYVGSCGERPATTAVWPGGDTKVAAHELMHALGAVAPCAPHYGENGHVTDTKTDLMYPETGGSTGDGQLDPGHDDYYKHHIENCIDISRHPAWTSS